VAQFVHDGLYDLAHIDKTGAWLQVNFFKAGQIQDRLDHFGQHHRLGIKLIQFALDLFFRHAVTVLLERFAQQDNGGTWCAQFVAHRRDKGVFDALNVCETADFVIGA
jgi:hypothetical protein